ncbi:PREDICTED: RING-H2 finger protein ATL57 [Camelina sativa]|uniref:RING-type E3 ubiquitin transferase n=1 Tax=Camelina sativa TaxID=90675 RepID=A0ABM0WME8_CAMSA|nr:PREDICTED: RING-H2 finger protein ATL57 [Camelina sativa]
MESKHIRKLLQLYQACGGNQELITTVQNATSSPLMSPPPPQPLSALDSTMTLTIFILLIALFFMGFFSVYLRHFVDDVSTAEISSIPRRGASTMSPGRSFTSFVPSQPFTSRRGLDSQAVRSLPVYPYTKVSKQRIQDCVICLSEFEQGETVKVIPHCGHLFHVECIDTWLSTHVTCPFCRSSQLFSDKDLEMQAPSPSSEGNSRRSTTEEHDTCTGVGPCLRRCSSWSSLGQRPEFERSLSL